MPGEISKLFITIGAKCDDFNKGISGINKQLIGVGAAMTAVGAAGLKMVDSARNINAQLSSTGITIGATTKEMRDMVLETANVTFGLDTVTRTFDILARAGVRNQEDMKASATAFDALADATGSTADVVADLLIPAFKNLGVEMPKRAQDLDAFTWLVKNTTVDLTDFSQAMMYVAAYGENLNLTINDMVAIMAALEAKGITGSAVTRVFRTAISQAASGAMTLYDALGLTEEEVAVYSDKLQESIGLTQKHADAMNTQYGIMDKLKFLWSKISFTLGSVLTPLEPLFSVMTAMGPVMMALSTGIGRNILAWIAHAFAVMRSHAAQMANIGSAGTLATTQTAVAGATTQATAAQTGLNTAMRAFPLIGIIAGVTALVFLFRDMWQNWEKWGNRVDRAWLKVKNLISGGLPTYQAQMDVLMLEKAWTEFAKKVRDSYEQISNDVKMAAENAITNAEHVAEREKEVFDQRTQYYKDLTADRLGLIDDQMMAELMAIDPTLAKEAKAYNKRLNQLEGEDQARQKLQEEDEKRALEEELRGEDLTEERKHQIEDQIADIDAGWEKQKLTQDMYQKIMASGYQEYFDNQKSQIDQQLENQTNAYKADLEAFKQLNTDKLTDVQTFVNEYNRIMAELGATSEVQLEMPTGPAPATRKRPSNPKEFFEWVASHFQYGGWITEPSLLYGVKSGRFYGSIAEAGPEYVSQKPGTTITNYNTFQGPWFIREEADIHKVARELKNLQDRTNRRAGLSG
jgi:flagellar biosynthesis GTPase FlhF